MSKNTPLDLNDCQSVESYLTQLDYWSVVTSLDKTISLPNKSDFGNDIQERVLEGIPRADLIKDTGLETLVKFLQEILGKEDIDDLAVKWEELENCRRG